MQIIIQKYHDNKAPVKVLVCNESYVGCPVSASLKMCWWASVPYYVSLISRGTLHAWLAGWRHTRCRGWRLSLHLAAGAVPWPPSQLRCVSHTAP